MSMYVASSSCQFRFWMTCRLGHLRFEVSDLLEYTAQDEVAQQDGGLIATETVDGGRAAPALAVINDVVVQERSGVNHLHDRGGRQMVRRRLPGTAAGQQDQTGPDHLPAAQEKIVVQRG